MTILSRPTSSYANFPRPAKAVGWGWGEILAPHHGIGMGLNFLDPTRPAPPLHIDKG